MQKILLTIAAITAIAITTSARAEVAYDYKNPEHKIDNRCVSVVSFARDLLFNDLQINSDGSVWLYTVEPTADVQKARGILNDLSNALILKYQYSKQFNDHYNAWKTMVETIVVANPDGPAYLKTELEKCKGRV
tara:strand:- start:61 stop:462 length:402 start_codon:yes stop_codon:yes gene_type:complete